MKTIGISFLLTILSLSVFSQNDYEKAMLDAVNQYNSAYSASDIQASAQQFERIAEVETDKWLPPYYASVAYCMLAFRNEDPKEKEAYTTKAQEFCDKAMENAPKESEVHALQGMIYQAIIGVDPQNNGQSYSAKANGSFQTAMQLDPKNPRPLYLQAIQVMYTPEQYGGGAKVALPMFEHAMQLFESFEPESPIYPNWGKEHCEQSMNQCQEAQASL